MPTELHDLKRAREITDRFLQAVDRLVILGKIKSVRQLCLEVGYPEPHYSRFRTDKARTVPTWFIGFICDKYPVNADWLLTGRGVN